MSSPAQPSPAVESPSPALGNPALGNPVRPDAVVTQVATARRIAQLALPALVVLAAEPLYVLVDTAVEILGDGALEDVELLGDDRFERAGREIADVDRHTAAPLTGGRKGTDWRGPKGRGRQRLR